MSRSLILEIDSKDRVNGSTTNFSYEFPRTQITGMNAFRINKCTVPYMFYLNEEQTFIVNYNGTPYNIFFEGGSYNGVTLANHIQLLINNTIPAPGITIQYLQATNKYQFNVDIGNTLFFDFSTATPTRQNYNLGIALGMVLPSNVNEVVAGSTQFASLYQSYIAATKSLFIKCPQLRVYNTSYFTKNLSNVIARIPVKVNSFNFINWQIRDTTLFYTDNDTIASLDIELVDEYDNVIDLQGYNWSFELEVFTNTII